jgi:hypothetical protein
MKGEALPAVFLPLIVDGPRPANQRRRYSSFLEAGSTQTRYANPAGHRLQESPDGLRGDRTERETTRI